MPWSQYLAGFGFFLLTCGGAGLAGLIVLRRRLGHLTGAPSVLAYALLVTAGILATQVVPLALGVLTRGTSLAMAGVLLVGAAIVAPTAAPEPSVAGPVPPPPRALLPPDGRMSTIVAALAVAAASVYELARAAQLGSRPLSDIDVMNFHLPGVARWIQSGSLWHIDQLFAYFVTGYYPNNGDAVILAAVAPWRMAAFARWVEVPFFALTALAAYALARELGSRRSTAAICAAALATIPALSDYALEGLPDIMMLFAFGAGAVFLLRHARTGLGSDLVLAGLGLGIAFGAKWYGLTSVAAVLVVWVALSLLVRRGAARALREAAVLVGVILLSGGIWLLRNVIESGNPLFPQKITALGVQLFPAPHHGILDRVGFTILGYLGQPSILSHYILPSLRDRLGLAGLVFAVGVAAAALGALVRARSAPRRPSLDHAILGVALAATLITLLYAGTPGSAFGERNHPVQAFTTIRWLMPAAVLAAGVAAGAAARAGRLRPLLEVVGLAAVIDGVRRGPPVTLTGVAAVLGALILVAGVGMAVRRLAWAGRSLRTPSRAAAAAVLAVLMLGIGGRHFVQRFSMQRYGPREPAIAWVEQHADSGYRIGLAGVWSVDGLSPVFPAFGQRLRNQVEYVGPVVQSLLREYTSPGPFTTAVRRGRYDLLLIGRGQPPRPRAVEEGWALSLGFSLVAESRRLALYRAPTGVSRAPTGVHADVGERG